LGVVASRATPEGASEMELRLVECRPAAVQREGCRRGSTPQGLLFVHAVRPK